MYQSGFLIVTAPVKHAAEVIGSHLLTASKCVGKKLYVKLEPNRGSLWPPPKSGVSYLKTLSSFLPKFYDDVSRTCGHLDVRLVLRTQNTFPRVNYHQRQIDIVLTDSSDSELNVQKYTEHQFNEPCLNIVRLSNAATCDIVAEIDDNFARYDTVVLGGTFDRLHNGHKVLLTAAVLRASRKLVIGITDGAMLKRKFLWELIEPVEKRMSDVRKFLADIEPNIEYTILPIYNAFGPTIEDPDMDCIVVSNETKRGGDSVNAERTKRNMKPLEMVIVNLVPDPHPDVGDEAKASSSNVRRRLLGTYLRTPPVHSVGPLCISLIGAVLHADCTISKELLNLGACVVNCELAFREMLSSDSEMRNLIIQELRENANSIEEAVDESKLCNGLLKNKAKLKHLSSYVWEKMQPSIQAKIQSSSDKGVVVFKVPVFFDVECMKDIHQVWGVVATETQQVEQLVQQYGLLEAEASSFVTEELSNSKIIKASHVIFSLQGNTEFVTNQVQKAWKLLSVKHHLPAQL